MVVETGVILAGTGYAGAAIAKALLSDAADNAPCILLDKSADEMLVDLILSERGDVAGAVVRRRGKAEPLRAPVVILAPFNARAQRVNPLSREFFAH